MIEIDFWRKIKTFIKVIIKVFMKKIAGHTMGPYYTLTHLEFDWMIRVAKSDLNSTEAYFATKKIAPKNGPKMT